MELREEIGHKQSDGVMNAPPLWVSACQLGAQHSYQFPFKLHPSFPSRQLWGKWIVEWAYNVGNEWPPKHWQGTNRIFMTLPNQARNWNFRFSKDCWFPACLEDFFLEPMYSGAFLLLTMRWTYKLLNLWTDWMWSGKKGNFHFYFLSSSLAQANEVSKEMIQKASKVCQTSIATNDSSCNRITNN